MDWYEQMYMDFAHNVSLIVGDNFSKKMKWFRKNMPDCIVALDGLMDKLNKVWAKAYKTGKPYYTAFGQVLNEQQEIYKMMMRKFDERKRNYELSKYNGSSENKAKGR